MDDDQGPLVRQLGSFRSKMLEHLADLQVDLTAYEMALQEEKPVSKEKLLELRREAKKGREYWIGHYAERLPILDGLE
jgi:hypothetical protein